MLSVLLLLKPSQLTKSTHVQQKPKYLHCWKRLPLTLMTLMLAMTLRKKLLKNWDKIKKPPENINLAAFLAVNDNGKIFALL
jgi:hypothetical protein